MLLKNHFWHLKVKVSCFNVILQTRTLENFCSRRWGAERRVSRAQTPIGVGGIFGNSNKNVAIWRRRKVNLTILPQKRVKVVHCHIFLCISFEFPL